MTKCTHDTCTADASYKIPVYCYKCPKENRYKDPLMCQKHVGAVIAGKTLCAVCRGTLSVAGSYTEIAGSTAPVKQEIRVGDKEKAEVMDLLAEAFSGGYMTQEEFYERSDKIYQARTRTDLAELVKDLPAAKPDAPVDKTHWTPIIIGTLVPVLVILIALIVGMGIL